MAATSAPRPSLGRGDGQLRARSRRARRAAGAVPDADLAAEFDATAAFWRRWLGRSRYSGRWREMVHRSALTLAAHLRAHRRSAALTTSLPEQPGGARNWDYRYTWIRDAAFTLYGLLRLGFTEEAGAFMEWLVGASATRPIGSRARCRSCTASTGART